MSIAFNPIAPSRVTRIADLLELAEALQKPMTGLATDKLAKLRETVDRLDHELLKPVFDLPNGFTYLQRALELLDQRKLHRKRKQEERRKWAEARAREQIEIQALLAAA